MDSRQPVNRIRSLAQLYDGFYDGHEDWRRGNDYILWRYDGRSGADLFLLGKGHKHQRNK